MNGVYMLVNPEFLTYACIILVPEHSGSISNNQIDYQTEYVVYLKYLSITFGRLLQKFVNQFVKAFQESFILFYFFNQLYLDCDANEMMSPVTSMQIGLVLTEVC